MAAYSKKLIIFDLCGTLVEDGNVMDQEMATLMTRLLKDKTVAIISGSSFLRIQEMFISKLPIGAENFSNLLILPASGASLYVWKGNWVEKASENLSPQEKTKIMNAVNSAIKVAGIEKPPRITGNQFDDLGSQITFSLLGVNAPIETKTGYDPGRAKRDTLAEEVRKRLPEFEVRVGGRSSLDITKRGVNKGFGVRKLEKYLGLEAEALVFIGDSLYYGGNDYSVKAVGIDCIEVKNPDETKKLLREWTA